MKFFGLILLKFFLISALFIISNGNLHITDAQERGIFFDSYTIWIKKVFAQGSEIAGYVIDSQWLPNQDLGLTDQVEPLPEA